MPDRALPCSPEDLAVAIDIGHTLNKPGAISARGVPEFEFNRRLGTLIADSLQADGFEHSFVVNADGRIASLEARVAEARRQHAGLFIAIHHDSVQPHYLSTWTFDGRERRYCDRFRGYSVFVSAKGKRFEKSRRLAMLIGGALRARGLTPTLHHAEPIKGENRPLLDADLGVYRYDGLYVLRHSEIPAVLLEAGVILNRDEERDLSHPAYRQRIAAGVVSAVRDFCEDAPASHSWGDEPR